MTLVKHLRDTLAFAELQAQRQSMGVKGSDAALHQLIMGTGAAEQGADYARALIARGILKNTPVPLDCDRPMFDEMVQQAFRDAKGGLLLVTSLEKLARHETFVSLATRAVEDKKCIVVLCGDKRGFDTLLAGEAELRNLLPLPIDMNGVEVKAELAARAEQEKIAAIESMTVVQTPVQPMKPLKFLPKTDK